MDKMLHKHFGQAVGKARLSRLRQLHDIRQETHQLLVKVGSFPLCKILLCQDRPCFRSVSDAQNGDIVGDMTTFPLT